MLEERIAVLETKMAEVQSTNDRILEQLTIINASMARYKGFMGGIMFVGSCVVTLITIAGDKLREVFFG